MTLINIADEDNELPQNELELEDNFVSVGACLSPLCPESVISKAHLV
jgi:hypothetical protein